MIGLNAPTGLMPAEYHMQTFDSRNRSPQSPVRSRISPSNFVLFVMGNAKTLGILIENVGKILGSVNLTHGSHSCIPQGEEGWGRWSTPISVVGVAVRVIPHEPREFVLRP